MVTRTGNSFKLNKTVDGKLCSTCCPPIQVGQYCSACLPDAITPEKLMLEFTGTTVNSTPSWSYIWFYNNWIHRWQWLSLDTIDGLYEVPLVFERYYTSYMNWECRCAGRVEVPLQGTFFEYWASPGGLPCGPVIYQEGWPYYYHCWSFDKLVLRVEGQLVPSQGPTHACITVVAEIPGPGGTTYPSRPDAIPLFSGGIYRPLGERTCFYEEDIPNSLDTPYSCDPQGPHYPLEGDVPLAWGGTVKIVPDGTYKSPVWLKTFSGPSVMWSLGQRYIHGYCTFARLDCDPPYRFKVQCKATCDLGEFIYESPPASAGDLVSLPVIVPNEGVLGFTTLEVTGIVPVDRYVFWDTGRDEVPSIVSDVFE